MPFSCVFQYLKYLIALIINEVANIFESPPPRQDAPHTSVRHGFDMAHLPPSCSSPHLFPNQSRTSCCPRHYGGGHSRLDAVSLWAPSQHARDNVQETGERGMPETHAIGVR
ncbi:hypothetical protein JTB14_003427 [Gonioctena quinquepunctata]|nr:hypothetical protein JTB14_003427 [Gonioctena quinquepunctata]